MFLKSHKMALSLKNHVSYMYLPLSRYSDGLLTGERGSIPVMNKRFFCSPHSSDQEVKRPGCEADHTPPSSARVKNNGAVHPLPNTSSLNDLSFPAAVLAFRNSAFAHAVYVWISFSEWTAIFSPPEHWQNTLCNEDAVCFLWGMNSTFNISYMNIMT
jgi:hypothetical protein